jgi:thiamine-phosphate pyrophosphorylase
MSQRPRTRLYLITPPVIPDPAAFARTLEAALDGGDVACLQLRLKTGEATDTEAVRTLGRLVIPRVQARGIAVLVNDRPDLAAELRADGVHVGQSDASVKEARRWMGPDGIVGATCHASRHLAMQAGEDGADYVAFGAFHPTPTKTSAAMAEPDILAWWQETMELPCVAIGGITPDTAGALAQAGADFIAVSSAVWTHPEGPAAAIATFNAVMDAAHNFDSSEDLP